MAKIEGLHKIMDYENNLFSRLFRFMLGYKNISPIQLG